MKHLFIRGRVGRFRLLWALSLIALTACGGGDGRKPPVQAPNPPPPIPAPVTQMINAANGGTINGPGGVTLTIPPTALAADTAITIAIDNAGSPVLPPGLTTLVTPMIALTPHGTTFSVPVILSLPATAGQQDLFLKTNAQRDGWVALTSTVAGTGVEMAITSFSHIARVCCFLPSEPPRIIGEPRDSPMLGEGGFWIFRVDVAGEAPFTFRWLRNGSSLPNEANQDILLNPLEYRDNGAGYSVVVADKNGRSTTSRVATLNVSAAQPVITNHPTDAQETAGSNAVFAAASTSSTPQTLQWKRCDAGAACPTSIATWSDYPAQTSSVLVIPAVQLSASGTQFALCASNSGGSTCSSSATLTVIPQQSTPSIIDQPVAVATVAGRSAIFTVLAVGGGLNYQWQRSDDNGAFLNMPSEESATFTISNVPVTDNGARFRVIVSNNAGTVLSDVALLTVQSTLGVALTRVEGGIHFSIGLRSDGHLVSWGSNDAGQLGNGALGDQPAPVKVDTLDDVATFSVGRQHSLALRSDGSVWSWGFGSQGVLGSGDFNNRLAPLAVAGVPTSRSISAGTFHSLAVSAAGDLWGWGFNSCGQLGDGTATTPRLSPVRGQLTELVRVAGGLSHSVALLADGSVWSWGCNGAGELGDGGNEARLVPAPITGVSRVIAIAIGERHNVALTADGSVYTWGRNHKGQLGGGTVSAGRSTPTRVVLPGIAIAVAAGETHSLALLADGSVYAWGGNEFGQIGNGTFFDVALAEQVPAPLPANIVAIGAGRDHSIAMDSSGASWTWGNNERGQLGDGTQINRERPVQVIGLELN